ncbi:hypothetical protein H9L13_00580 [Sphingomonas lutea]|uniref:DUF5801 domain-containing protein n=1 Tax=Sphingomonas lutea TaxID=1045317 RepID=A0A7G9SI25_9SPHN|nr:DUF5801 repeats-in-toxin domain-containing protein [Sphingomonas lutea]QNN67500.1 hypothetical protein H9L13_00580 [Sphingomonas lutea]
MLLAQGSATGLFALNPADTDPAGGLGKGAAIVLYEIGGVIYGSTAADVAGVLPGNTYFTISVDGAGDVTLTRSATLNMWHDDAGSSAAAHDDPEFLLAATGTLKLEKTVTDADGDTAKAEIDLSQNVFRFEDDGPTADPDTGTVVEGQTLVVPANGVRADDDFGTDGPGTIIGVAKGTNVNTVVTGNVGVQINGDFGKLTLNADGSYTYVSTDGLVPAAGATDTFVYTIRDADGDTSTTTLTINLTNNNRTPIATQPDEVWLDDDTLGGNADGPGDRTPDTQNTTGTLSGTGGDGDLDVFLSATQTLPSGFTYAFDPAAPVGQQWLIISQGGTAVIKVTLVNESGDYTVTQLAAIDHAEDGDTEGEILLGNLVSQINVSFYVQDSDVPADQSAPKNLVITVDDDTPENNGTTLSATVHEDALNTAGAVGNAGGEGAKTATVSLTVAQLKGLVDAGADTPITIGLNAGIEGTNTGLTQLGIPILWDYVSETQVRGLVNGDATKVVFTLTFDAVGQKYDFVLLDNIDNNPLTGAGDADTDTLQLTSVFTATDADGDTIVIDGGATINIENDVPINNGASYAVGTVYEDGLNTAGAVGNATGEGAKPTTIQILGASLATLVAPGADAPVTIALNLLPAGQTGSIEGTNTGLTQNGTNIVWDVVGAELRGVLATDATKVVFTITDNAGDANFTFTLLDNIDNNPLTGAGDADTDSLSLAGAFVATDTDGDKVIIDAGATLLIENDVPINNGASYAVGTVYEDGLNTAGAVGNATGEGAKPTTIQILGASLATLVAPGADAPVTIALNLLPAGQTGSIEGTNTGLTQNGTNIVWDVVGAELRGVLATDATKVVFTIADNAGDANFTFTLLDNIDNNPLTGAGDADTDSLSLAGAFVATDTDGDKVIIDAGATLLIENDVPINNGASYAVGTVYEDGLNTAGAVGNETGEGAKPTTIQILGASLATLVAPGADAPVTIALNLLPAGQTGSIEGTNTGLTQNGTNIVWDVVGAELRGVLATDATKVVFTITDNAGDANFTFTLLDNIDNNPLTGAGDADTDSLSLAGAFVATDTDGDKVIIDAGATLLIENDVPINNGASYAVGTVYEDGLNTAGAVGNATGEGAKPTTIQILGASLATLVAPGADAPVTIALNLLPAGQTGSIEGTNTGLTQNGTNIVWDVVGAELRGVLATDATKVVFTITDNAGDANFTFTLLDNIDNNPLTGAGDADTDSLSLAGAFVATDTDGDKVIIDAGATLLIENDVPIAAIAETGQNVSIDESAGNQLDSNDVSGPRAEFNGVTNQGNDLDVAGTGAFQFAFNNTAIVSASGVLAGADAPVSTVFSLTTSNPTGGADSGLDTTEGVNIWLFVENGLVVGRVGATALTAAGGPAAFAIAIDQAGKISMAQYLSIQHNLDGLNPDDAVSILDGALKAVVEVTDSDGDKHSAPTDIGNRIIFQDSGPVLTAASNINIANNGDFAHTGTFAYDLGADGVKATNDVFKGVVFNAKVNTTTVATNVPLTQVSEDADKAIFSFSFTYATSATTNTTNTGTITFWKTSAGGQTPGTYTVDLASAISGFTIVETSTLATAAFVEASPAVTNIQLATNLSAQFTSVKEPASGDGANNLRTIDYDPDPSTGVAPTPELPAPGQWVEGELFNQSASTVQASSSAIGVGGNTVGGGEVLEFNLYSSSQGTTAFNLPTASSPSMFITLDGVGTAEDFIVVLKLWQDDGDGVIEASDTFTTRALVVQNSDIIKSAAALTGTAYQGINLDNNDGVVIFEANDFNKAGENFRIVGAQIINSDEDVDGLGIDFQGGVNVASNVANTATYQDFQTDAESQPFKVKSVGFLIENTTNQTAELKFDVTIQDGDNDSVTQQLTATVGGTSDTSTPITLGAPVTTVQSAPGESFSTMNQPSNDNQQMERNSQTAFNTVMMSTLAAAGLEKSIAAAEVVGSYDEPSVEALTVATIAGSAPNDADVSMSVSGSSETSSIGQDDAVESSGARATGQANDNSLTDDSAAAGSEASELDAGTELPAAENAPSPIVAQDIALPAEMLELDGGGVQHNAIVGKVLVDALDGGGSSPNLDALINAISGGTPSLEPVATLDPAHVPGGDTGHFAGFTMAHDMPIMEQMMTHQDAAPAVA